MNRYQNIGGGVMIVW